ncbi:hypothetical protein EOL96_00200 [Candidatus Saccharibacteria bacterium]|nr:hypothetical protein [Candidatus Saccharibacteria bacterium]
MANVAVQLDGAKVSIEVEADTVKEALEATAAVLGYEDYETGGIVAVVNGEDAELEDSVAEGDQVTATSNVING